MNENNNIGVAGPITVLTRPDLAVPATVPPPTSPVNAGATLTFPSVTASNIGGTDSGPWRYAYYVSQSATFNPTTAMQLGSSFAGPASFPPGATFVIPAQLLTVPSTLTVDPATGLANYYFFLFVDSDQAVVEITKANNVATMGPVVVSKKANLVVPASLVVQPSTVNAGSTVQFPYGGAQVLNSGNGSAGPRTYGIYYSANATFDATATLLQTIAFSALLPPGGSDSIAQQTLTIPLNIARDPVTGIGTYYLYLVADIYNTVVESNRANNVGRSGPLTVYAPAYGFLGLQSPCNGLSCSGNAGASSPLLWQFTLGGVPVDSPNARPEIWIYLASCTTWAPGPLFSAGTPDDPGSSSWQYPSGSAPFTWQYNWKDPLATPGCYLVYIGSRASGQTVPNGTAFGPVRFTLK